MVTALYMFCLWNSNFWLDNQSDKHKHDCHEISQMVKSAFQTQIQNNIYTINKHAKAEQNVCQVKWIKQNNESLSQNYADRQENQKHAYCVVDVMFFFSN